MWAEEVMKQAKYKTSVEDPGVSGVLQMTMDKFLFRHNDPASNENLEAEFKFIKCYKLTAEESKRPPWLKLVHVQGHSYIFEFESFPDLHVCRELVIKSWSTVESKLMFRKLNRTKRSDQFNRLPPLFPTRVNVKNHLSDQAASNQ